MSNSVPGDQPSGTKETATELVTTAPPLKRVLAIDGGGLKGVFPASFLASVEEAIRSPVAGYFDLVVGTSTGGIIALGLGLGLSAKEILAFYTEHGPRIFSGNRRLKGLRQLTRAKYDPEPLKAALGEVFGEKRVGDSRTRLVVPSFDLETGVIHVYKTAHHQRFVTDYKAPAIEVAMATAAAPTYFPTFRSAAGVPLVDGGIWANNPAGTAAVEALGVLDWPRGSVRLLSIGCTTAPLNARADQGRWLGFSYWAKRLVPVFMAAQSSASVGTAQLLLGHDNVQRYSTTVSEGRFRLDAAKDIESLRGLGANEARRAIPALKPWLTTKAAPFEPYYRIGADLSITHGVEER
jgi:patatin-like phospholipase/acyl hydrolase